MNAIPKLAIYMVYPKDDYTVYIYYDNGRILLYDCSWVLKEGGVFEPLHNPETFKELCTVMNGTLAWDISGRRDPYNCIDICPDTLLQDGVKVKTDPLRDIA
jgi:hypothetical protein